MGLIGSHFMSKDNVVVPYDHMYLHDSIISESQELLENAVPSLAVLKYSMAPL